MKVNGQEGAEERCLKVGVRDKEEILKKKDTVERWRVRMKRKQVDSSGEDCETNLISGGKDLFVFLL